MDDTWLRIFEEARNQYGALILLAAWGIYKAGLVQFLTGVRASERVQLSADQHRLVEDLRLQVQGLDARMFEERKGHERRIQELRTECETEVGKLQDQITTLIKGESRWRHLTGNLAGYVYALQSELRKVGVEVPRFGGWDKFIEDGGDPMIAFPLGN